MKTRLFTSESVTSGHPDKMCDQISDAVLDAIMLQDPDARVACETVVNTGIVYVLGEITTKAKVNIDDIVRSTIKKIGYDDIKKGFDYNTCAVLTSIKKQSEDIALGVDRKKDIGAGDQGMMIGFACNETDTYMPMPIYYAHEIVKKLSDVRMNKLDYLRPDGKAQVTVLYENGIPVKISNIVVSCQHKEDVEMDLLRKDIGKEVLREVIPEELLDNNTVFLINPTGRFAKGGPSADAGLTGRKIIVDTYGGYASHGGGAFSGKDPTKVDRSGAYMARYIAKNVVASGLADKCEIQLAYAIGIPEPVSVYVNTYGTGKICDGKLSEKISSCFKLRPKEIIDMFDLRRPIYEQLAVYGHFGRPELDLPWERLDKVELLQNQFSL